MTFKDLILEYCKERGMFDDQALNIYQLVYDSSPESMQKRMENLVSSEGKSITVLLLNQTKRKALEWIDQNQPEAFYRVLFEM